MSDRATKGGEVELQEDPELGDAAIGPLRTVIHSEDLIGIQGYRSTG